METTVATTTPEGDVWGGGNQPLRASYGKMMMWFFIVSDALTFSGFLAAYGFSRFKFVNAWPIADEVFTHFPFLHGVPAPMFYVAFMTFVLIFSSVTMVLAVDAGHKMQQSKVAMYMFLTIIGGAIFVGSQAWEWATFIKGDYGAVETRGGKILQFLDTEGSRVAIGSFAQPMQSTAIEHQESNGVWFMGGNEQTSYNLEEVTAGFLANDNLLIRTQYLDENGHPTVLSREASIAKIKKDGKLVVEGANLKRNEYGHPLFADFFFFITGFHGFHVFSGVMINIIIFFNVVIGTYERRKSYEMVEKVGLYWHFVDLVWVFVFTFFYLV
ncbi:MAG TPA: cytochrome oxidase subunit III [Flavobacteriaceae bacterium]|nr:cytochrome c oxidase subunit 3 [Ulvibacter sp.]CAI8388555.1 MAG: putative cytochrome c oxidase subunit 3 [Flavobacteriaceae bacterium]HAH34883.1 cytochrome oxidase subunit III [Flavobacteriaceae bacterium]|tara:strand:+ start:1773 stop:2753 length:981 start_codon:yes stop_codon:yes gene_type:complete